jgi:hypothetical protein
MAVKNLRREAESMLGGLSVRERYNMFTIVLGQMGKRQSAEREAELVAVYDALVRDPALDKTTLRSLERGHQNSMSNDIRGGDLSSNAKKNRKKS